MGGVRAAGLREGVVTEGLGGGEGGGKGREGSIVI